MSFLHSLPTAPGSYRWFYADAVCGDYTAVAIFMVGAVFSPRYAVDDVEQDSPREHCAVNFALYRAGKRVAWVLSHYPELTVSGAGARATLGIGRSRLTVAEDGAVLIEVDERTPPPASTPITARLELRPSAAGLDPQELSEGHWWQPLAPRAEARLSGSLVEGEPAGHGYLDTNHGDEPLGLTLPGWRWRRTHDARATVIHYERPGNTTLCVRSDEWGTSVSELAASTPRLRTSGWGLPVPLAYGHPLPLGEGRVRAREARSAEPEAKSEANSESEAPAKLLESSPFYARLEARTEHAHTLGEVADFRRFRSPWIRWMAHFRSRREAGR